MTAPAVSVDGLHLRYGETRALDDLTFTPEGGRIYGLLGRNGSGKTSLLSLLAAFRKPTSGTVLVDGEPVWENFEVTSRVCLIRENGDLGEGSDRVSDALAIFGTVSTSLVDPAATVLRWFALGYGTYLFGTALPTHIAHGQTRRNFMVQAALFVVAASIAVGAVLTAMYALEGAVFDRLGWVHEVCDDRLYAGPGDWGLVLLTYSALLAVWAMVGSFLSAAFHRTGGWRLLVALPAIALVVLAGSAVGVSGLPFAGRLLDAGTGSLPGALAGVTAAVLAGAGLTWAVVRDLPVRRTR